MESPVVARIRQVIEEEIARVRERAADEVAVLERLRTQLIDSVGPGGSFIPPETSEAAGEPRDVATGDGGTPPVVSEDEPPPDDDSSIGHDEEEEPVAADPPVTSPPASSSSPSPVDPPPGKRQLQALAHLVGHPGASLSDMARAYEHTGKNFASVQASFSPSLKGCEQRGWVRSFKQGRSKCFNLTDAGRAVLQTSGQPTASAAVSDPPAQHDPPPEADTPRGDAEVSASPGVVCTGAHCWGGRCSDDGLRGCEGASGGFGESSSRPRRFGNPSEDPVDLEVWEACRARAMTVPGLAVRLRIPQADIERIAEDLAARRFLIRDVGPNGPRFRHPRSASAHRPAAQTIAGTGGKVGSSG